ncbi:MAG: hypothetical protein EOT04_02590 [Candidatus Chaera renei]|uniref:GlxA-like beta barrel domain-containing protein n=1 Tax=Candidatus Chaera renei TaxID=2506947 RepID=A0A4Q0AIR9_9BACT|nr:MAG: hypothetical protein EOT04_02590 [Candidatus Chaera renei]
MKKDVIYIDVEDDITSIIAKVKQAGSKIVALVPPRRSGVLQSAVNLKLLRRAAVAADKHVVLITSDRPLSALAAGVRIPVARNLQSRPQLAPVDAPLEAASDTIDGRQLPVGELAGLPRVDTDADEAPGTDSAVEQPDAAPVVAAGSSDAGYSATTSLTAVEPPAPAGKGLRIPNFESFRKRLFWFGGLGVLLLAFLVWAIFIAPRATVVIAARADAINIDKIITMNPTALTDVNKLQIKPEVKQIKKTLSTEFAATGSKDVGNKASGAMTLSNSYDSSPITVKAGTIFTAQNGLQFTNGSDVQVPGAKVSGGGIVPGTATITVTAVNIGPQYNLPPQKYSSSNANVSAAGDQMSGGSKDTVTVVSADDVNKARQQLGSVDVAAVRTELVKQFSGDVIIVQESFKADTGQPSITPAVGEQATRARLTQETTYTLIALSRTDVRALLGDMLNKQIDPSQGRRIYSLGDNSIYFSDFQSLPGGAFSARLITTGYIGPNIDPKALAAQLAGKRYGEVQQIVGGIKGVDNVDVRYWPFWVNQVSKPDRINIKFTVKNAT